MFRLDRAGGRLWRADGDLFDPGRGVWAPSPERPRGAATGLLDAAAWRQRESGAPCRVPVGVIGPRQADEAQCRAAESLGRLLAEIGLAVLCGGREGVMTAVCRGVAAAGGTSIGLLPDESADLANPYVTIPIATGIGVARNAIVARAALCLVSIGGGYGTASEVAFGLQFGKVVMGLLGAPMLEGVRPRDGPEGCVETIARIVLHLPLDG